MSNRGFWRDLPLDANGNVFFMVTPSYAGELWLINTGTQALTINLKGKNKASTFTISKNTAFKFWVDNGDTIGISGGVSGDTVSITSVFDEKPLPTGADIIGSVKLTDGTTGVGVDAGTAGLKAFLVGATGVSVGLAPNASVALANNAGAWTTGQKGLTTTASQILLSTSGSYLAMTNLPSSASVAFIGPTNAVTGATGFCIPIGTTVVFGIQAQNQVFGICAAGTATVSFALY